MSRVISTGSIIVDASVRVPRLPTRGTDVLGSDVAYSAGGGFNLASAAARFGAVTIYAGRIGDGPNGAIVRRALSREGIIQQQPRSGGPDTGICFTLIEPDGERTFVTVPGAESQIEPRDLVSVRIDVGDIVSVSGYDLVYPNSSEALSEWAAGLPTTAIVVFDPGPLIAEIPPSVFSAIAKRCDLLTLNQAEARILTAAPRSSGLVLAAAVREVLPASGARTVVVREGSAGCFIIGGELPAQGVAIAAPNVTAVDTTGAGDAHTGVLLAALSEGIDLVEAARLANFAAAMTVTRRGPAVSPTRSEIDLMSHG